MTLHLYLDYLDPPGALAFSSVPCADAAASAVTRAQQGA